MGIITISIHAPAGGATLSPAHRTCRSIHFNSRPCGRGDSAIFVENRRTEISIHAPAGGATNTSRKRRRRQNISIHAPAGGATSGSPTCGRPAFYFNSRPCGRGDRERLRAAAGSAISIHAPAGGATWPGMMKARLKQFQFTPLREGRLYFCGRRAVTAPYFNSRPCGRGDGAYCVKVRSKRDFNSRPCGRGDSSRTAKSTHRPPFQFTPLREGRQIDIDNIYRNVLISIHAPAGGATACWYVELLADTLFQFTPLREGRLISAPTSSS